ncbi:hypothetical protein LCGC14_1841570 [marine sediment metagenome]|uniref:Uncharacterized protein n=1 Tax=marine sediment metagenome TaxID=412755 RepID=A0A0F9ISL8_9ZZZZ|nr:hypothetical protein [Candidatus Scalindua sp.]
MDKIACKNCKWFEKNDADDMGVCRLNPPVKADKDNMWGFEWPVVGLEDWCGKFVFMRKKPKTI